MVSEHVVRVRGKRRRRKVKDTGGCGSSQATRRLSPLLKRPVWNHGACPCLTAPHAISRRARWPCWPASTQLEQNESRVGFGVSSEEGRWDSLFQSEQYHRDWKAQAMGLLPESTFFDLLWWVHRVEPGVLSAHARMHWLSDWPPASTPPTGLLAGPLPNSCAGSHRWPPTLVPRPAAALAWLSLARWTSCTYALHPSSSPNQVTQQAAEKENQSVHALRNCFCVPKASKKHAVLFPFFQYHQLWYFIFNHSNPI